MHEQGSVLVITLDRPEVLNAVDGTLTLELGAALQRLEDSPRLRTGVITGAGRAFCAGLDLKAVAAGASLEATRHPQWGFAGMTARRLVKPVVAAVNGDAVGGGLEIALACDVMVVAQDARLGLPEVRHGLIAVGGGVRRLVQQLPEKAALELLLTGRLMTAVEAAGWGLASAVVPADEVLDRAIAIATTIAANAPRAVEATKRLASAGRGLSASDAQALAQMDEEAALVFPTRDAREGMAAFAERREPRFTGD
jgi:crotonobetainyl-CoA hydratase